MYGWIAMNGDAFRGFRDTIIRDLNRYFWYTGKTLPSGTITPHLVFSVIKQLVLHRGFRSVFFFRVKHRLRDEKRFIRLLVAFVDQLVNKIDISEGAEIGPGLFIPYAQCIVIGMDVKIGENATIYHGTTIGEIVGKENEGKRYPEIGNNVLLGAGSKILGPITVGDNSMIGANAVLLTDIPANTVAVGIPAQIVNSVAQSYPQQLEMAAKNSSKN